MIEFRGNMQNMHKRFDDEMQTQNKDQNENPEVNSINQQMRIGFIRKVYGVLSAQLLITVIMCSLTFNDDIRQSLLKNMSLFWFCLGLSIVTLIPLVCCKSVARKVPINYVLLFIWTFCQSYMVAVCCSVYEKKIVFSAAAMTCGATIALTLYACTTKDDFSVCGGLLFVTVFLLFIFMILSFFFNSFFYNFICFLSVIAYSIYLVMDTQLVMGNLGVAYEIDDYIIAAMNIYIDIIQIFLRILELLGRKNS